MKSVAQSYCLIIFERLNFGIGHHQPRSTAHDLFIDLISSKYHRIQRFQWKSQHKSIQNRLHEFLQCFSKRMKRNQWFLVHSNMVLQWSTTPPVRSRKHPNTHTQCDKWTRNNEVAVDPFASSAVPNQSSPSTRRWWRYRLGEQARKGRRAHDGNRESVASSIVNSFSVGSCIVGSMPACLTPLSNSVHSAALVSLVGRRSGARSA